MQKNINRQQIETKGFYIQNILGGPLVICDPPHLNGLYLDPLQPGETKDLTYYDPSILSRSIALNNALSVGYAIALDENEYNQQRHLAKQKQIAQHQEMKQKMAETAAAGGVFEAEQINLATAGNPHGDYAAEALMAQENSINNPEVWASEYRKAKMQGLVSGPIEFKELVESGRLSTQMGSRGKRVSVAEMQNADAQDQINMTATRATIAMPGSYEVTDNNGEPQEMGGVYTQRRELTNFNATGSMVGAEMGIIDSPTPAYSTHPMMQKNAQIYDDSFVEEIDIDQEDDEYEAQYRSQSSQVAEKLNARSPYIGQSQKRPIRR